MAEDELQDLDIPTENEASWLYKSTFKIQVIAVEWTLEPLILQKFIIAFKE